MDMWSRTRLPDVLSNCPLGPETDISREVQQLRDLLSRLQEYTTALSRDDPVRPAVLPVIEEAPRTSFEKRADKPFRKEYDNATHRQILEQREKQRRAKAKANEDHISFLH